MLSASAPPPAVSARSDRPPRGADGGSRSRSPRKRTPRAPRSESHLPGDVLLQQVHQCGDLLGRALPVLLAEREQGQHPDPRGQAPLDRLAHRGHSGRVPQRARERTLAAHRPLPSMMTATCAGTGPWIRIWWRRSSAMVQTSMISASLVCSSRSICLMCSSCSFCTSFSARFSSSSETCSSFFSLPMVSVRAWRTAMRPSSASL